MTKPKLKIGTRSSKLALAQTQLVCELIPAETEVIANQARGDKENLPNDKERWVVDLEEALLAGEIDIAVHSAKDVPGKLRDGLKLLGVPLRGPAFDVLVGVKSVGDLSAGAVVGTSSLRRRSLLGALYPQLEVMPLRGNVDTRLMRLEEGVCDAVILAAAGLERLGYDRHELGAKLSLDGFTPAAGQGALVLEVRADRIDLSELVPVDLVATACLFCERAVVTGLAADCDSPLGVYACSESEGELTVSAYVGSADGSVTVRDQITGPLAEPVRLGDELVQRLKDVGASELLQGRSV